MLSRLSARDQAPAFAWIVDGREPTEGEHRLTLCAGGDLDQAAGDRLGAGRGGVQPHQPRIHRFGRFAAVVVATIWLGGETTCALAYLSTSAPCAP